MSDLKHLAIIPDGNRRFGRAHLEGASAGHKAGVETFGEILKEVKRLKIPYLTFYAFSTENWKRSEEEVSYLMDLFAEYFTGKKTEMIENKIEVRFIGRRDRVPQAVFKMMEDLETTTKLDDPELIATFAIDYGGHDELVRAFQKLNKKITAGELLVDDLSTADIEEAIDNADLPPPDLIIRTSGEQRLSGFLLWQSAYSEFYFANVNWPEFTIENLHEAIMSYESRERRLGGN